MLLKLEEKKTLQICQEFWKNSQATVSVRKLYLLYGQDWDIMINTHLMSFLNVSAILHKDVFTEFLRATRWCMCS